MCILTYPSLCGYYDLHLVLKYIGMPSDMTLTLFPAVSSELVMPDDLDDGVSMSRFERVAAPGDNCSMDGSGLDGPEGNVDSNDDCSPHPNFVSMIK